MTLLQGAVWQDVWFFPAVALALAAILSAVGLTDFGGVWTWVFVGVVTVISVFLGITMARSDRERKQRKLRVDYLIERGMSPSDAERQAERERRDQEKNK